MRTVLLAAGVVLLTAAFASGQDDVASTLHNLSSSGPGEIKALGESRICRFCHIPHNAVAPVPLWGHALSKVERYEVPRMRRGSPAEEPAPQPSGSSRLCLSCHDGTVAVGDIGQGKPASLGVLDRGRRGFIGTDLSGSHPVSFVVPDGAWRDTETAADMALRPLDAIQAEEGISLDADGKMQCTTCHDPHSDRYYRSGRVPRFWVRPTVDEVCLACHEPR